MAAKAPASTNSPALRLRRRRWRVLGRDVRGVAALEFALIVPALVMAAIGVSAVSQGLRVRLLLGTAATSMVDLVASQTAVTPLTLIDFCSGGIVNSMLPYNPGTVGVTVARYTKPVGKAATGPDWTSSFSCPTGGPPVGAPETSLANTVLVNDGDVVILVKANYVFKPSISFFSAQALAPATGYYVPAATLSITRYQKARNNGVAACTACTVGG